MILILNLKLIFINILYVFFSLHCFFVSEQNKTKLHVQNF